MSLLLQPGDRVLVGSVGAIRDDIVFLAAEGVAQSTPTNANHVLVFESLALRDAYFTAPVSGDVAYVDDTQSLYIYSDETVPGWGVVGAWPDHIPLNDLSDVVISAPSSLQVLRYNGSNWVNATEALDDLSDVIITTPATGHLLRYNGTNWVNVTPAAASIPIDDLSDVTITSAATDNVLQYNGSAWVNKSTVDLTVAAASTDAVTLKVSGDTQKRLIINGDGSMEWGSGSGATDLTISRTGAGYLFTNATIQSEKSSGGSLGFLVTVTGDTQSRFTVFNSGTLQWGSGSASQDTNLYRSGADTLRTDDSLSVGGSIGVGTSVDVGTDLKLDSRALGRGQKLSVSGAVNITSTSASTAAGSETSGFTSFPSGTNSMTWVDGHIYRIFFTYQISDNINSSYSISIARLYRSGGGNFGGWLHYNGADGHLGLNYTQVCYVHRATGAGNLTAGVAVTMQRYISGVAGSSFLDSASVMVEDIGLASDNTDLYNNSVAVT